MTYDEALDYIGGSYKSGKKHSLGHVRQILAALGKPQAAYRIIHVAGTNGKGSTCAMLSSILRAAGYRTGLFISPHLISFNERISINGAYIGDGAFAEMAGEIRAQERASADAGHGLSFFEILTLMALLYFARERVDFAVIETGIGGRLDATNAVERTFLSVITSIGYDHCELLGSELEKIAAEKAGIIKKKNPVVLYLTTEKVYNRIQVVSGAMDAKLYYFDKPYSVYNTRSDLRGTVFSVSSEYFSYMDIYLPLLGQYQLFNACHALLCVKALNDAGANISEAHVKAGIGGASWPGRMEILRQNPLVIADGAHNPSGAEAFSGSIEPYRRGKRLVAVVGILKSKDAAGFMQAISRVADAFVITQPPGSKALPAGELAAHAGGKAVLVQPDFRVAVSEAIKAAGSSTVVSVVGSLYLIGGVKKYFAEVCDD